MVIKGNSEFGGYLTGEAPNPVEGTTVALDFQAPGSQFTVLDHHEELPGESHDRFTNSQGAAIVVTPTITRLTYQERFLAASETHPWNSYKGETFAASLAWGQFLGYLTSTYRSEVPAEVAAAFDPTTHDHLSFRVGQVFLSTGSPNPTDQNQDFQIRLEDAHGNLSPAVPVSDYAPIFPAWKTREGGIKTVMGVVRIPLSAFPAIDLHALRAVEFLFTVERAGEIVFDDIRLTQ